MSFETDPRTKAGPARNESDHSSMRAASPQKDSGSRQIWFQEVEIEDVSELVAGNMLAHLGIEFTKIGPDFLCGSMPVDRRTKQPYGLLHGGASVVLAETLASVGANLCVDPKAQTCVGLDLASNHIGQVTEGRVFGTARPIHLGRRTQIWEVRIEDERGRLTNLTRLTLIVLGRPQVAL